MNGGSALDAVEAAVSSLENETTFDAGRGSYFNAADEVEMDAIIMDGRTLTFGAVAAIQHVLNPVRVARLVLERTPHHFMVGQGATAFAREMGLLADPGVAVGKRELEEEEWTPPGDTVGAVALDLNGNLAVATSTGGTPNKHPGRVGDSPLVGCGAYADNLAGAASATGSGEHLMRVVISKAACDRMAAGMAAQQAVEEAIRLLQNRVNGYGGLIAIDREGRVGLAHNTPNLTYAYRLPDQELVVGMSYAGETTVTGD
jgi:beta-aspartyl-peptidase (threonine type)